jgi:hypothetical protein
MKTKLSDKPLTAARLKAFELAFARQEQEIRDCRLKINALTVALVICAAGLIYFALFAN